MATAAIKAVKEIGQQNAEVDEAHHSKRSAALSSSVPAAAPVNVVLADSQSIYRVGIRKIFGLEDDIRVVAQAENFGQAMLAAAKAHAHVILMEAGISPNPAEAVSELLRKAPGARLVIVFSNPTEEQTMDLLRRGVSGIIPRSISPDLLVRCVRKVAAGELWLDNRSVNMMVEAYRSQAAQAAPRQRNRISDKELMIIAYVSQGFRNKDIAAEIGTTEQVIKNYLRKIYGKLGVSDRLELAIYCVQHGMLKSAPAKMDNVASDAPSAIQRPLLTPAQAAGDATALVVRQ